MKQKEAMPSIQAVQVPVCRGWYWGYEWRYFDHGRPVRYPTLYDRYAEKIGYAALCRLVNRAQEEYLRQKPINVD